MEISIIKKLFGQNINKNCLFSKLNKCISAMINARGEPIKTSFLCL